MTDEEVAVKFEAHEHELASLKHRMNKQEETTSTLQAILLQIKEISITMKGILEEQKEHSARLDSLEEEPAKNYKQLKMAVSTAVISSLVGAIVGA